MVDWSVIANIAGNIANVLAVGIAAWSTWFTVQSHKQLKEQENSNANKTQSLLWYNKMALEDYWLKIDTFVNRSNAAIYSCRENKGDELVESLRKVYDGINDEFRELKNHLFFLKLLSVKLYRDCDSKLQKINDIYSKVINQSLSCGCIKTFDLRDISTLQLEFTSILYKYGKKIILDEQDCV